MTRPLTEGCLLHIMSTMNEDHVRDRLIRDALRRRPDKTRRYIWKGTHVLRRGLTFTPILDSWAMRSDASYLFTVAYVYKTYLIHYVAFIYTSATRTLLVFDPGYNLYLYGKHKIIPLVVGAFRRRRYIRTCKDIIPRTRCPHSTFGVQFDGRSPRTTLLPADVFCQTWTLFFITMWIQSSESLDFFDRWCRVSPEQRKHFLVDQFVVPVFRRFRLPLCRREKNDL